MKEESGEKCARNKANDANERFRGKRRGERRGEAIS
jgi:hypothetical protein